MKPLLPYILLCIVFTCKAQDSIVFYSGFEENGFPVNNTYHISEFNTKWFSAWGSPDIFSYDYANIGNAVPNNGAGSQEPVSGQAYGGFATQASFSSDLREWFGSKLQDSLLLGKTYCIKFYISCAELCGNASNNIGIYFSGDSIYRTNVSPPLPTPYPTNYNYGVSTPQNTLYNNSDNWVEINLNYTAKGDEKYFYIGNFYPDSLTSTEYVGDGNPQFGFAYYYIDEFLIYKCKTVGLEEFDIKNIKLYPNPAQDFVSIDIPAIYQNPQLSIYNLTGQLVAQKQIIGNQQIPISDLGNGMYIFVIQNGDKVIGRHRVVVAK
jgi:Secretion system C-terminal sorting domain